MKTAIIGILNNPATSINSHSAGMVEIVRSLFDADILNENDDWNIYDKLIIYHGVNFKKGSYNIIGGINKEVLQRCKKLNEYKHLVFSLDGFQLNEFSKKRKLKEYDFYKNIELIELPKKNKLLIGDSHSISVWPGKEYNISRMDGKTLYGFLKNPIKADYLYFGNIDIRFHLCRQKNPEEATRHLVRRYIEFAKSCNAKVSCLLPVESENRKLPNSGLYKGKAFYGSQLDRANLVDLFNNELLSSGLQVNEWPQIWYEDINFYQNNVMEPKQSVHIRPKFYQKNK